MTISIARLPFAIAVVASFVAGGLVYGPLLGAQWTKAMGRSKQDMEEAQSQGMAQTMSIALLIRAIQIFILIHMIYYMAVIDGIDTPTLALAAKTSFWMWLGFILVAHTSERIWDKSINRSLRGINIFGSFLMLLVGGLVYVALLGVL